MPSAQLTGAGVLTAQSSLITKAQPRVVVLSEQLHSAPTSVLISVTDGIAHAPIQVAIDGAPALSVTADSEGGVAPTSVPVADYFGQGQHTLSVSQSGAATGYATFELTAPPQQSLRIANPDAPAVEIVGAVSHGTRHFVFQDLLPGGLGSYVLPVNPSTMTSPHSPREISSQHTTHPRTGKMHLYEGGPAPHGWQLRGMCPDKAMHDQLLAYAYLRRRFYVIDHRNRAWKVVGEGIDLVPRRRTLLNGVMTDWMHDYTLTLTILDPVWGTPQ